MSYTHASETPAAPDFGVTVLSMSYTYMGWLRLAGSIK